MEIGEHGNNLNLNIGGRVTCGLGRNLPLRGAKEAAQKIRKRRIPHGSTTMLKSNRRYQQLSSAVHPGLKVECLQGSAHVAEPDRIGSPGQIVESYDALITQLTRHLGSSDFAHEALHEAFLQLEQVPETTQLESSAAYILRTAIKIAKNRRKSHSYRVSASEIEALLDVRDDAPDPARVVEARSEIEAFKKALAHLPEQAREVLRGMSIEGKTAQQVAEELKVSVRTVGTDLREALQHCAHSLHSPLLRRLGGSRPGRK
jgi:RNA polymerase sigma-70 factor (ECF subfamily)